MIIYVSNYGTVEEYVSEVARRASERVAAVEPKDVHAAFHLKRDKKSADARLSDHPRERALIISPIYAGRLPRAMRTFLESHRESLMQRPVAVALSCLYEGEEARLQLNEVFPAWLLGHAHAQFLIGGRVIMSKLSGPTRFILKRVLGHGNDVDTLAWSEADRIVDWLVGAAGEREVGT